MTYFGSIGSYEWPATDKQLALIHALAEEIGLDDDDLEDEVDEDFGCSVIDLTRRDASAVIDDLLERKRNART